MATAPRMIPDEIGNEFWLDAAHATVRAYCGWHVAPVITESLRLDGSGGHVLLLPSMAVKEIQSLTVDDVDVTGRIEWSTDGIVQLRRGRIRDGLGNVEITLEHGFAPDEVADVAGLILNLAKRAASSVLVESQSVNGASVRHLTAGGAPLSIPLLGIEKSLLAPYRLNGRLS